MGPFKRDTLHRLRAIEVRLGEIDQTLQLVRDESDAHVHSLTTRLDQLRGAIQREQAHLDQSIRAEGDKIMSALSDKIAVVGTAVDDAATRVQTDVASLKAQIAALQAQVDAGGASQADLDALDALKTKLDQIDPATPTTLPTP